MRFSLALGNPAISRTSFEALFGHTASSLRLPRKQSQSNEQFIAEMSRIDTLLQCSKGNIDCAQDFHHDLTSRGVCNVYNGVEPGLIYNESPHLDLFSKIFSVESQEVASKTQMFGPRSSLHLILDNHRSEVFGSESGSFTLAFSHANNSFDALTNSLELLPGNAKMR